MNEMYGELLTWVNDGLYLKQSEQCCWKVTLEVLGAGVERAMLAAAERIEVMLLGWLLHLRAASGDDTTGSLFSK